MQSGTQCMSGMVFPTVYWRGGVKSVSLVLIDTGGARSLRGCGQRGTSQDFI